MDAAKGYSYSLTNTFVQVYLFQQILFGVSLASITGPVQDMEKKGTALVLLSLLLSSSFVKVKN